MKRIISLLLATVLLVGFLFNGAVSVSAETEETAPETTPETTPEEAPETAPETETVPEETKLTTSDECVTMLKEYEGFCKYPYADYGQYTVGYGTRCPSDMVAYYSQYGITEEEAELLLRNYLEAFERDVYQYADKYQLELTQNQFDALIMFSYNCGSGWLFKESSELHRAIANGAGEEELVYRFSLWCTAGGSVLKALIRRRLCETNMYVNGVYSTTPPENYCYVIYNANGGNVDTRVQGYKSDAPVEFASTATYKDHIFLGWFTEKTGGTQITALDASVNGKTLYAQWDPPIEEELPEEEAPEAGETPDGETPDTEGTPEAPEQPSEEPKDVVTVKVNDSDVNYRKGPGTNYTILGQKQIGDELQITDTREANGYTWGQFEDGWIALVYTNYAQVTNPETSEPEQETPSAPEQEPEAPAKSQMGTIKVNEYLNIRQNPGTGYTCVGIYGPNDRVEILEQKAVGATMWGRTDRGWISMDYVELDKDEPAEPEVPEQPEAPEQPEEPAQPETKPDDSQTSTAVTGVVSSNEFLRIRSGPGTSYDLVGYLYAGDRVTITELKNSGSMTWGKIEQGWISMAYITLDSQNGDKEDSTEQAPPVGETGTVNVEEFLRVRSGPGTSYAISGYLNRGDKVTVTEKKTVGATVWGKIEQGWISLDYIVMDNESTENEPETDDPQEEKPADKTVTGIVTSSDFLRVRSGPGTSYSQVSFVYAGDKLTITEQTTVDGVAWGKITQGWVCMDYVRVVEEDTDSAETVTKTITADCLNVRSGAGTGYSIVGYLYAGTKVEVSETKTVDGVTWGKIATGWISLEYTV